MSKVVLSVDFPVAIRYVSKFGISQTMGSLTKYELIGGLEHSYFSIQLGISSSQLTFICESGGMIPNLVDKGS